ncbi:unnamed protein product, partial [marine sediment metagenome]
TNTITVAATAGLAANDWVEVRDNGCANLVDGHWRVPRYAGVLRDSVDMRMTLADTAGVMATGEVVTVGAILEEHLNFPDDATDDMILVNELSVWNPNGGVEIKTRTHSAVNVNLPDMV